MRIESCRKCGKELTASTNSDDKCAVCGESIRVFCSTCNSYNEIQFHIHILDVYTRKQLLENTTKPSPKVTMTN